MREKQGQVLSQPLQGGPLNMLSNVNEFVISLAAIIVFLAAIEIGFRLGLRYRSRSDNETKDHVKLLVTALLGLLALLLGFNFAMASSRFDARKALIQEEVNAIGTTWLRGQLLPEPQRHEVNELLKSYVAARIDFMRAGVDENRLASASAEASHIDAQIWAATRTMVVEGSGGPQVGMFIAGLNEMGNVKWKRYAALDNHVPEPVLYLLLTVAVGALGFIGYSYGLSGLRRHRSTAIFATLIALVFATILDFDRPRGGFIRIGEEGILRLQAAFDQEKT
jgi:hypothetical protein